MPSPPQSPFIRLLLSRLEHISVDSPLAHRASGLRGALLKNLEIKEAGEMWNEPQTNELVEQGLQLLQFAALERIRQFVPSDLAKDQANGKTEES
jgi:hypothetical protein